MTANAIDEEKQKLLQEIQQKANSRSLGLLTTLLEEYQQETGEAANNAIQLSAVDGFMITIAQVLGYMAIDTVNQANDNEKQNYLASNIEAMVLLRDNFERIFFSILDQAKINVEDKEALVQEFSAKYKVVN